MSDTVITVNYEEVLAIQVARVLRAEGFDMADDMGNPHSSLKDERCLGLLIKDPKTSAKRSLWWFSRTKASRLFVGLIWFDDEDCGAKKEHWIYEVYGEKQSDSARKLADKLSSRFKVSITIRLMTEEEYEEGS